MSAQKDLGKIEKGIKAGAEVISFSAAKKKASDTPFHSIEGLHDNGAMSPVSKDLLDARLDAVRSDVRASIAESSKDTASAISQMNLRMELLHGEMRTDMQSLRADFATMLKDVAKEMAEAKVAAAQAGEKVAELQGSIAEVRGSITGLQGSMNGSIAGLQGSIDGLKSSINMHQWAVAIVVAVFATIVTVVIAWPQFLPKSQVSQPTEHTSSSAAKAPPEPSTSGN